MGEYIVPPSVIKRHDREVQEEKAMINRVTAFSQKRAGRKLSPPQEEGCEVLNRHWGRVSS